MSNPTLAGRYRRAERMAYRAFLMGDDAQLKRWAFVARNFAIQMGAA